MATDIGRRTWQQTSATDIGIGLLVSHQRLRFRCRRWWSQCWLNGGFIGEIRSQSRLPPSGGIRAGGSNRLFPAFRHHLSKLCSADEKPQACKLEQSELGQALNGCKRIVEQCASRAQRFAVKVDGIKPYPMEGKALAPTRVTLRSIIVSGMSCKQANDVLRCT